MHFDKTLVVEFRLIRFGFDGFDVKFIFGVKILPVKAALNAITEEANINTNNFIAS